MVANTMLLSYRSRTSNAFRPDEVSLFPVRLSVSPKVHKAYQNTIVNVAVSVASVLSRASPLHLDDGSDKWPTILGSFGARLFSRAPTCRARTIPRVKSPLTFGLSLLLTGCPTVKHEAAGVSRLPAAPIASSQASAASAAAMDAGPPATMSAPDHSEAVWTPPPGDTLGTIACDQTRCRAGQQACAWFGTGLIKCVPRSPTQEYAAEEVFECDEGSDCPTGSICCSQHMGGGFCEPRVGNAPPLYCNSQLCVPDAGAPCPKGTTCEASGDATPGVCVHPVRATCAPGKRCSAEAGYCVWTYATASGQCGGSVDEDALEAGRIGVFRCTKTSDCGAAMRCATDTQSYTRGTFCAPATEPANSYYVCDTDAQCRSVMEGSARRARCVSVLRDEDFKDNKFPPWMSICRFD